MCSALLPVTAVNDHGLASRLSESYGAIDSGAYDLVQHTCNLVVKELPLTCAVFLLTFKLVPLHLGRGIVAIGKVLRPVVSGLLYPVCSARLFRRSFHFASLKVKRGSQAGTSACRHPNSQIILCPRLSCPRVLSIRPVGNSWPSGANSRCGSVYFYRPAFRHKFERRRFER